MTGEARIYNGTTPQTPNAGYTTLFVDQADKQTKQIADDGTVTSLVQAGGIGGLVFAPSGAVGENDFKVTEEGVLNDSIRISAGSIDLILLGVITEVILSNDFIISHADGMQTSGVHKVIALPYKSGDESFINTPSISLFVAPSNEATIAVIELSINILGRGQFDVSTGTTQDYRDGIELTKMFYFASTNLSVSGRPWSVFDRNDAANDNTRGNSTTDHGCEPYDDGGVIKFRTTKNAIVNRRAVAPVGSVEVEQYATEDIFLGMWKDKAKTVSGLDMRIQILALVDAQGQDDYVTNSELLPGGTYEDYWNWIDLTSESAPSQAAVLTSKAANLWSLIVFCEFAGSGNTIMIPGKAEYNTADIDAAADSVYASDWSRRSADLNIVGAFLVQSGGSLTLADIVRVPAPKTNITQ